jgi:protein-disulfide isomerase-like protein with CxxC motif
MAMSAKDFNAMAIEFGLMLKEINYDSDPHSKAKRTHTVEDAYRAFCRVATASNPTFDQERFYDFVSDVMNGTRDKTGKKAK